MGVKVLSQKIIKHRDLVRARGRAAQASHETIRRLQTKGNRITGKVKGNLGQQ